MKKITELDKNEKKMLLKAIVSGEIDRKSLTPETRIAIKRGDWFLGLMMRSGNEDLKVVCLGEAKEAQRQIESFIELSELNFELKKNGMYLCTETGEQLTSEQIKAKEDQYLINIEIVDDLNAPPAGYQLIPRSKEMFINDLQEQK